MATYRGLCRCLGAVAAFTAFTTAAASPAPANAERQSGIIFLTGDEAGFSISSGESSIGESIEVHLEPDVALPKRLVIDIPSGYTLDLGTKPGEAIGQASLSLAAVDTQSFAVGIGEVIAEDPATYARDDAAQKCAPGAHAAVWAASIAIAGQQVGLTFFVDPAGAPSAGYVLQACPSGLAAGQSKWAASISLFGFAGLESPTSPGSYVWHAAVTPQTANTYELQALVPLPESISLRTRYERRTKTAVLTGKLIEGGAPVPKAALYLTKTIGNETYGGFAATRTRADGTFSFRSRTRRTADFMVSAAPSVGPCTAPSHASGACLASTTIAPDAASTTVWVSVPGGAVRAYRSRDQHRAEAENLSSADLPAGFQATAGGADRCANQTHESNLTITGENTSPTFFEFEQGDSVHIVQASGLARVYATQAQARYALKREARPRTAQCELTDLARHVPPIHAIRLPHPPARVRAFRATITDPQADVSADFDFIFIQRGRSVVFLRLAFVNAPDDLEQTLVAALASRLR